MRVHATAAIFAFATGRDARDQDMVAVAKLDDAGTDSFDDANTLVADNAPWRAAWHVAKKVTNAFIDLLQ
jgi:hypothetical protein